MYPVGSYCTDISRCTVNKILNLKIKFHENRSNGSPIVPRRLTGRYDEANNRPFANGFQICLITL